MEQKEVWDAVAKDWAEFRTRPVDEAVEFLKNRNGVILDLGCGSGRNFIEADGLNIYGVDFSEKLLKIAVARNSVPSKLGTDVPSSSGARNSVPSKLGTDVPSSSGKKNYVELRVSDVSEIPYGDEFFDAVVFVRVLHCVEGEGKRVKTLREVYRVLKNGGEAVISTIGRKNQRVKNKPKEGILPWTVGDVKYERYNYIYDKDELVEQLKNVGFEIISVEEGKNIVVRVRK